MHNVNLGYIGTKFIFLETKVLKYMSKWQEKNNKAATKGVVDKLVQQVSSDNYAAIDLGTNSCRLVIATPTPSSFRIVETFSKITRLGEGIINNNELSHTAIRRTVNALRVCAGVLEEYAPIKKARFVNQYSVYFLPSEFFLR